MDEFTPYLLPDLDSAEVIEAKNFRYKKFAHIEFITKADGSLLRVCRPFGDWPVFYVPIKSLESEYTKDLEIIRKAQKPLFPSIYDGNPDDYNDNDWTNQNCFSQVIHEE